MTNTIKNIFSLRVFILCRTARVAIGLALLLQAGVSLADDQPPVEGFVPQTLQVPDPFTVELAASPPLVKHPTFATFDNRGGLFVCENAGVNMSAEELEKNLPNSIRLLQDTDDDGVFDTSTLFADKMTFPMGGAWHDGALYVASPPSIWRLEDTTGDGVADKREVIVNRFGYTGNAASIHGCFFGPDGRIYWCDGYHGHEFKDEAGNVTSKRVGSYIFSCKTDGSDVRIYCGGGMDNPVEVDFTDEGELLGAVNIFYTRPRVDCLVHWLHGGAYPHREQVLKELKVTGDLLGPVHRFGHVAISGTMRYRSGLLDPLWRDNQFGTYFNSGKVVRLEMERDGATFSATQREFLSSSSQDFHPTDVVEDADGSLLVVDTGGWFYRGCPTSQHAKPDIQGAIYRVRKRSVAAPTDPAPTDPWGNQIDWSALSDVQLIGLLGDSRFKVRERAIAQCASRGQSMVPSLQKMSQQGDVQERQNSLWTLTRIVGRESTTTGEQARVAIRGGLDDQNRSVRLVASRSLSTYPDPQAQQRLLAMLQTDEPPVRREVATALGRLGDSAAVPALLDALAGDIDRSEEHAIIYALIEINDPAATRLGLNAKHSNTQRGSLIALDQMDGGNLVVDDLALIDSDDIPLQQTVATLFSRHPDWSGHASEVLARLLALPGSVDQKAIPVRRLTTTFLNEPTVGKLIGSVLDNTETTRQMRDLLLAVIAEGQSVPLHENWDETFDRFLDTDDPQTLAIALSALGSIKTDRFRGRLEQIGGDSSQPILLRVDAIQIASGQRGSLTDEALDLLVALLDDGGSTKSLQAAQKIGSSALSKPQLLRLAGSLLEATPSSLQELLRPFQRTGDADVARAFLDVMKEADSLTSLAPHEFSDVIIRFPRDLLPLANELLQRIRLEEEQKLARLDKLLPLLKQGDVERGRELFFAQKSQCANCHRVGDKGAKIGPDLTTIGSNRAASDLLESIVLPSATLVRDYEPFRILTIDGRVLTGLIVRETTDTIFIQQQTGDPVAVPRDDIEELKASALSIMPNGLEKALSESELADVIAYLKSLK